MFGLYDLKFCVHFFILTATQIPISGNLWMFVGERSECNGQYAGLTNHKLWVQSSLGVLYL